MALRHLMALGICIWALPVIAAEVRLRSSAVSAGAVVRVEDVAEVLGDDRRLVAALADIPLCPAPAPGNVRALTQHEVRQLLALSGVESAQATVTGSEATAVSGGGAARTAVAAKRPLAAAGMRQALFETEEAPSSSQPARPAAAKPAERSASDPKLAAIPLVDRGTSVTVQAKTAGIRITTTGKALEAGPMGATIAVEIHDAKQPVLARVVGPQTVEVTSATAGGASSMRDSSPPTPSAAVNN